MQKNKLFFLLLFSFSLISFSQNPCEKNLDKAKKLLFENSPFNDGETIFKLINSCTNEGNLEAESLLGLLYLNGIGTNINKDLAFKHVNNAANKGFANAQYNLGRMYKYGVGCDLNFETAIEWFKKATKNGNQRASYSLGYMYFKGLAVSQDYAKAIYWFEQSEDYMAKHYLGLSYYLGYGVEPNENKALELLLNNPIANSKALVTYIQNNRKQKIEEDVNQVLEENDTESENNLNLKTTATNSNRLETVTKEGILGEWEGKFIQYDWSGKTIVRILPIELSISFNEGTINVMSSFEDKNKNLKAVWQDNSLYFENPFNFTLDKLFSHNLKKLTLDYRLLSLNFKKHVISNKPYLVANVETYIDEWKEYGRPSRVVLKQKSTSTNLDEDIMTALAAQEDQKDQFIKIYPVPFKNQLTVQYQLEVTSTVHVELLNINGGNSIVIKPNETQEPGDYKYSISGNDNLPSGLYVVRLTAGNQLYSRLIIKEN